MTITIEESRRSGYDCGMNGANMTNCHFLIFSTPENTRAWECGKADAEAIKAEARKRELA